MAVRLEKSQSTGYTDTMNTDTICQKWKEIKIAKSTLLNESQNMDVVIMKNAI